MPRCPSQASQFSTGEHACKRRECPPLLGLCGICAQQRHEAAQPGGRIAGFHELPPPAFETFAGGVSLREPSGDVCQRDVEKARFAFDFFRDVIEAKPRDAIARGGSDRIERGGHGTDANGEPGRAQRSKRDAALSPKATGCVLVHKAEEERCHFKSARFQNTGKRDR